ncbi:MAG: GFA family protein [Polyangiaceae bacterium]
MTTSAENLAAQGPKTHAGSCHCGAVRFEVELDLNQAASRCNCSVCTKIAATGLIVKPEALRLLAGEESLGVYEWGGRISKRYFCKQCGIHCFGRGHLEVLGGDYASVNCNALDDVDVATLQVVHWDGRHNNWMAGPRPEPWPVFTGPSAA